MSILSTPTQLDEMRRILTNYVKLPFMRDSIPGNVLESALSHVRGAAVLNTYDFVDVVQHETGLGWQVKSAKERTPVTWKRAKLPDAPDLIAASRESDAGLQALGDAIIAFCNAHARESLDKYELQEIGYSRLILGKAGQVTYFERLLCSPASPDIFNPADFRWQWSTPKATVRKEQLSALHGTHRATNDKWWAWHGLGENQLHFSGEAAWWPAAGTPNVFSFQLPPATEKLSFDQLMRLLASLEV